MVSANLRPLLASYGKSHIIWGGAIGLISRSKGWNSKMSLPSGEITFSKQTSLKVASSDIYGGARFRASANFDKDTVNGSHCHTKHRV